MNNTVNNDFNKGRLAEIDSLKVIETGLKKYKFQILAVAAVYASAEIAHLLLIYKP